MFGIYLVKKLNAKNKAWQNFGLVATDDGRIIEGEKDKLICKTRGSSVLTKGSNTLNLFQHLREHHPFLYSELAPSSKPKCVEAEP